VIELLYLQALAGHLVAQARRALLWRLVPADTHSILLVKTSAANAGDELRVSLSTECLTRP